jgi:hypothetical protein
MYQGASDGAECPLVVDTSTRSCGTSRFGCWVCTVVDKDRSMEAMIKNDEEKVWMTPLLERRNELDKPDDRDRRDFRRMTGRVQLMGDGATVVPCSRRAWPNAGCTAGCRRGCHWHDGPYTKQFTCTEASVTWRRRIVSAGIKITPCGRACQRRARVYERLPPMSLLSQIRCRSNSVSPVDGHRDRPGKPGPV